MTTELKPEKLRKLLDYDSESGALTWKARPLREFPKPRFGKTWNAKYAGQIAGAADNHGYINIRINRVSIKAHRAIWAIVYGDWPPNQVDHINGVRNDNRLCNLRSVSQSENQRNAAMKRNNTSGVTGVHFDKRRNKWCAQILKSHIGTFDTKEEAAEAHRMEAQKLGCTERHGRLSAVGYGDSA